MSTLYLLHFDMPLGDPSRPRMSASHYLGCTDDLDRRLNVHRRGLGPSITAALVRAGGSFTLVWQATGDRTEDRRLKNAGHFDRRCAVCRP